MRLFLMLGMLIFSKISFATDLTCESNCRELCRLDLICRSRCEADKPSCMPSPFSELQKLSDKNSFLSQRLLNEFTSREENFYYVVSRIGENQPDHLGDSLLWTSLASASVSCDQAGALIESIARSVEKRNGALVRFEPLPQEYEENATSRDQETGAIAGLALTHQRCQSLRPSIENLWRKHADFIERVGKLYQGNQEHYRLTPGFKFLIDLASHVFLNQSSPHPNAKALFESANVSTAAWTEATHAACYPIHLATLQLIAAEVLGSPVKMNTYRKFCDATATSDLPLTDWYCRRMDEASTFDYLDRFNNEDVNLPEFRYEYRHQRCGRREAPDLGSNQRSPAIDYLFFVRIAG